MSKLKVYDMKGQEVADVDVADELLSLEKGGQAVHDAVVNTLARRRAGTASTLSKAEVAGSGKKPWKQKGLGRARAGYRQSPVWRGGAVAFGPRPRKYGGKVNRKVAKLAFSRALGAKVQAGEIKIVDALKVDEPKTKLFSGLMRSLDIQRPALFVVAEIDTNTALSARNITGVSLVKASDVNAYQLLRFPQVVVTRDGLDILTARLNGAAGGAE